METLVLKGGLLDFFNSIEINLQSNEITFDLMVLFPCLKSGHCCEGTLSNLLCCYMNVNNLMEEEYFVCDEFLHKALPTIATGRRFTIEDILSSTSINLIQQKSLCMNIYKEIGIAFRIANIMCSIPKYTYHSLYYFLEKYSRKFAPEDIFFLLEGHPKVDKLCLSIIKGTSNIGSLLSCNDARRNNFEAFFLSLLKKDDKLTTSIINNIILRTLLHKELLRMYVGDNFIRDLYFSMVKML